MNRKLLSRILAGIIVLGTPLGFFFYWKKKVDALPQEQEKVQVYWKVPDFKYQTQNGDTLSSEELMGSVYVADFIFTSCGSICPELSKTLAQVQETFKDDDRVKLVSFSIDPLRDSIPALKDYSLRYGAQPDKWFFLRGDTTSVWQTAQDGFKVPVVYTPEGGSGNEFTHTDKIVLVDKDGMIRGYYSGMDKVQLDSLYNNIARLLLSMS